LSFHKSRLFFEIAVVGLVPFFLCCFVLCITGLIALQAGYPSKQIGDIYKELVIPKLILRKPADRNVTIEEHVRKSGGNEKVKEQDGVHKDESDKDDW
jgi:hypothetical protein